MSVEVVGHVIHIAGNGGVEDAEPVLVALQEDPTRVVDLSEAAWLHSAIIQLLLAVKPTVTGSLPDPFLTEYVLPLLDRGYGSA
jgi:hypothetical protein